MKKTHYFIAFLILATFALQGCFWASNEPKLIISTAKDKVSYILEIADSYQERKEGLMFRTSLPEKHGMLFVFDRSDNLTFWMKNTLIPLDIIFFDGNYKVVSVLKNLQPCKVAKCPVYNSQKLAQYALEVNAGESDKFGIVAGDIAQLSN